jgi:hypothetical protein
VTTAAEGVDSVVVVSVGDISEAEGQGPVPAEEDSVQPDQDFVSWDQDSVVVRVITVAGGCVSLIRAPDTGAPRLIDRLPLRERTAG